MAYQVSRHKRVQEELELTDENGKVIHSLKIDLDADALAKQISEKYVSLIQAQRNLALVKQEDSSKQLEAIGNSIIDLFETVFGRGNTEIIIKFYENKYIEMCQEVLPFVINEIIPKVRQIAQESRNKVMQGYNRKQKRAFGRKK